MNGLEYLLKFNKTTQLELSEKLGTSKQNINLWIKGKQNIPHKYIPILKESFGVDEKYFQMELSEIDKLDIQVMLLDNRTDIDECAKDEIYLEISIKKMLESIRNRFDIFENTDEKFRVLYLCRFIPKLINKKIKLQMIKEILYALFYAYDIDDEEIDLIHVENQEFYEKLYYLFREEIEGEYGTREYDLRMKLFGHYNNIKYQFDMTDNEKEDLENAYLEFAYLGIKKEFDNRLLAAFKNKNIHSLSNYLNIYLNILDIMYNEKFNSMIMESTLDAILKIYDIQNENKLLNVNPNLVKELEQVFNKYKSL